MTRTAYDAVAHSYAELLRDELSHKPLDRRLLDTFADMLFAGGGTRVLDAGCGPGRVSEYLHGHGLTTLGIDVSPAMIDIARRGYPALQFDVGSILDLNLAGGCFEGVVAWYSIIHTPPKLLTVVFAEFWRVLAPGGLLLLSFQVGDERVRIEHAYGHAVAYDVYRLSPEEISDQLSERGFQVEVRVVRAPTGSELQPQAYIIARK
ncbi:class I SAM-dependent methyltransferase [Rhodococcus sp. PAMC28707]|uniref:class I SAM-dependent DNA methyltransferase n=1 Tax=unclassified Rhodococcus (in: high G+C Gram-positive bacteria) TaxID=192944 RepID=UPI00109DA6EC|nr:MULTISPECIES: class I SAM-dependent methyltransferase [unclassified Rhodococcus (in: high G+C Gram-positive bacteria)]QCB50641.1 class I SAM-dependent methyltransferase [Rhodococcus sp. PAMC28705]QCB57667.1 class I SAM-dependent methyltransferase [Rhodococcus sp. PAMC28707]